MGLKAGWFAAEVGSVTKEIFDVIQIGRGPVGLTLAALLADSRHSVALVERHRDMYGLPRAGHVDHEIVRLLAALGAAGPMLEDSYPTVEYRWVNAEGEVLMDFDWGAQSVSGYNSDFMQFQPLIEQALNARIVENPHVCSYLGRECVAVFDRGDHVEVLIRPTATGGANPIRPGEEMILRGRYLVGADGANSMVRRQLGIERDDLGFNEKWLVVDALKKREIALEFDCGQICDPRRPVTILPLGKRHRRWEWALLPGEDPRDLQRPEMAWKLLAEQGVGPDDLHIIRQLVYTFEARHARSFRQGRAFLMGDAAHTMPPFMGQGMCSGMRDAANLSWKLDLVLRGVSGEALLDSYELERSPHSRDWTLISLEAGKVPCTIDPDLARERDERFRNGWKPPMPDFPKLVGGILHRRDGAPVAPAGELGLQARVAKDGVADLLDHFVSPFVMTIISTSGRPETALRPEQRACLSEIGVQYLFISSDEQVAGADLIDVDGRYRAYFASYGVQAGIFRPDFYVFGLVRHAELPSLVDDLLAQLNLAREPIPQPAERMSRPVG